MEEGHIGVRSVEIFGPKGCRAGKSNIALKEWGISLQTHKHANQAPQADA